MRVRGNYGERERRRVGDRLIDTEGQRDGRRVRKGGMEVAREREGERDGDREGGRERWR